MKKKISKIELKGLVKRYLSLGLTQKEMSEILNMSPPSVYYWVKMIRKEDK